MMQGHNRRLIACLVQPVAQPFESRRTKLARRLVREARVGVAPGMSFGEESEGWLRLCFAQDPELLRTGLERMADTLR